MTPDDRALLEGGGARLGLELQPAQLDAFARLAEELLHWNRRINLTAITGPTDIVVKHFLDSLTLCPLLTGGDTLLDLGSGAGFPSIPLKIAMPGLPVTSVDAVQKKVHFQRHVIRTLGLGGITALHGRIEDLAAPLGGGFTVVTSRAFSSIDAFAGLAAPLLAPGGRILAMKGPEGEREAAEAAPALARLGLSVVDLVRHRLPAGGGERTIVVAARRG